MRDHDETTKRYSLELDMIERASSQGPELLRSEFAAALNASYLMALSGADMHVGAITRSIPQEGVSRYVVEMVLDERHPSMTDAEVAELVEREFAVAQNSGHFLRMAVEDFSVRLLAREHAGQRELHPA